nr:uncharacterized protein LOC111418611 [Onthophagus taurus]
MGTRSILKVFLKNLGNSRRILPVKLAPPLLEIFDKKFQVAPRSVLDIYKIDESKKWVVAVRESQKNQYLKKRFANSVSKLFKNWGVRHYSNIKKPPSIQAFLKTDEKKSCVLQKDGNFNKKFLPVNGFVPSLTQSTKNQNKFVSIKENKQQKGYPISILMKSQNKNFQPNLSKSTKFNVNRHKNEVRYKKIIENKAVIKTIPEYVPKMK